MQTATQEPSISLELDFTPPEELLSDFLSASLDWLEVHETFIHHASKLTLQGGDHLHISFPYVSNSEIIHAFENDCVPVCLAYLVRQERGLQHPLGTSHPLNYDDITLLVQYEQQHSERLHTQQKETFSRILELYANCIGKQLFGKAFQTPTLEESITGDIVLSLMQPQVILIHQEDHTCKLISLTPGLTLDYLLSEATQPAYLLVFMDNHLDVVPFSLYSLILNDLLQAALPTTKQAPLQTIPGITSILASTHLGSESSSAIRKRARLNTTSTTGEQPRGSPAPVQFEPLSSVPVPVGEGGPQGPSTPHRQSGHSSSTIFSSHRTTAENQPNWTEDIATLREQASERQVITPPSVEQNAASEEAEDTSEQDEPATIGPIAATNNCVLGLAALATTLQAHEKWRQVNNLFVHFRTGLKIELNSPLHDWPIRLLINGPVFLPEVTTLPHDCAFWHLTQYIKFLDGMHRSDWTPTLLTEDNLDRLALFFQQSTYRNDDSSQQKLDRYMTHLRRYLLANNDINNPQMYLAHPFTNVITVSMVLQFTNQKFFLYEVSDNQFVIARTQPHLGLRELLNPAYTPTGYLFAFTPQHVRLLYWTPYQRFLSNQFAHIDLASYHLPMFYFEPDSPIFTRYLGTRDVTVSSTSSVPLNNPASNNSLPAGGEEVRQLVANAAPTNNPPLYPVFAPPRGDISQGQAGFTPAQWQRMLSERQVGKIGRPALFVQVPSPQTSQSSGDSEGALTVEGSQQQRVRIRRRLNFSDNAQLLDIEILAYYRKYPRGRNCFIIVNINVIGSGLRLTSVLRPDEFIPIVGKWRETCTTTQLRRIGGVTALPGNEGYLIESYAYDAGYGSSARLNEARLGRMLFSSRLGIIH